MHWCQDNSLCTFSISPNTFLNLARLLSPSPHVALFPATCPRLPAQLLPNAPRAACLLRILVGIHVAAPPPAPGRGAHAARPHLVPVRARGSARHRARRPSMVHGARVWRGVARGGLGAMLMTSLARDLRRHRGAARARLGYACSPRRPGWRSGIIEESCDSEFA